VGVSRRFDDHGELVFAQFIRGLNENHERFDACASPVDHAANLTSRMGQRLRRWQRQHDFPRRWRFEVAVSVGGAEEVTTMSPATRLGGGSALSCRSTAPPRGSWMIRRRSSVTA
jgi:hypothetical protein